MIEAPLTVRKYCNTAEVSSDKINLNDVPFLTCASNDAHYSTSLAADNLTCLVLEHGLKNVIRCYSIRAFNVVFLDLDIQFKIIKDRNKVGVLINFVRKKECALVIKRCHRILE